MALFTDRALEARNAFFAGTTANLTWNGRRLPPTRSRLGDLCLALSSDRGTCTRIGRPTFDWLRQAGRLGELRKTGPCGQGSQHPVNFLEQPVAFLRAKPTSGQHPDYRYLGCSGFLVDATEDYALVFTAGHA